MNSKRLSDIEEEVIKFLEKSRNRVPDSNENSFIKNELQKNIYFKRCSEDEKLFSNLQNNHQEIEQKITEKFDYSQPLYNHNDFTQDITGEKINMWDYHSIFGNCANALITKSNGHLISHFNDISNIFKFNNGKNNYLAENHNLYTTKNTDEQYLEANFFKNDFDENSNFSKKNNKDNNCNSRDKIECYSSEENFKANMEISIASNQAKQFESKREAEEDNLLEIKFETIEKLENGIDSMDGNENNTDNSLLEENNENYIPHYFIASTIKDLQDDRDCKSWNSSTISNYSDKEDDFIEEIIIKEKINRINNPSEDSFDGLAESIIYESHGLVEDNAQEKKELLCCMEKLSEAIEHNILMRNYLYDLEYALLRLIEGSSMSDLEVKSIRKIHFPYRKRKFYLKFLAPYFKDKRGISSALYVHENIMGDGDDTSDYRRLYHYTYQPQIYDVYNAIKVYFDETAPEGAIKDKKDGKKGRKKNYESEYCEVYLYSMESQFMQFLRNYKSQYPQQVFDKEIDWYRVALNANLQGMSSVECKNIWSMVLKPLIQLGAWNKEESDLVLNISEKYGYQNWDEIAKELGTGRTEYLCFCHVMSKPIQRITQNTGPWTKSEDEFLLSLVNRCRYGKYIMWGRIFYYIDDRTVTQILNRWYRLNPALKRGKFSQQEDSMLMYCIEQFGRDFGKIARLFGNRSPIQLRERYFAIKDLTDKTKLGEWSVEEDRLLLSLVEEYGESKWAEIAAEFPGRNRTQIRHRYASVLKRWLADPNFQLESLKRYKRTTHMQSVKRVKEIDTSEEKIRLLVQRKLKNGKVTLKREKRAGKQPTIGDDSG